MVHCIVQSVVVVSGALGLYSCLLWAMVRHLPNQDNCHSAAEEVCANAPVSLGHFLCWLCPINIAIQFAIMGCILSFCWTIL